MSRWFFSNSKYQEALGVELSEWLGTPFRHMAGVKKVGADCVRFASKVYEAVGALKGRSTFIPYYGHDWCHHTTEEKFYIALKKRKDFEEVLDYSTLMNGDLILYKFSMATSHCGIYFDKEVYQAVELSGVHKVFYKDALWYNRRRFLFRIKNI